MHPHHSGHCRPLPRSPSVKSANRLQSSAPPNISSWTCQRYGAEPALRVTGVTVTD